MAEAVQENRQLSEAEGSELAVWLIVAIVVNLVLVFALIFVAIVFLRQYRRKAANQTTPVREVESKAADDKRKHAWENPPAPKSDLRPIADEQVKTTPSKSDKQSSCQVLGPSTTELCETLRVLMEEEIATGLQRAGISDRLERLERKEEMTQSIQRASLNDRLDRLEKQVLAGSLLPADHPFSEAKSPASMAPPSPLPPARPPPMMQDATTEVSPRAYDLTEESEIESLESPTDDNPRRKDSGPWQLAPTSKQIQQERVSDNIETASTLISEDASLKLSLQTVQKNLAKRDTQTQELHRQLRQAQQALWQQTLEARGSSKRLHDLLKDSSLAPKTQAEEMERLEQQIQDLSGRLMDVKSRENQWSTIAKRQRAFFVQSERLAQEGLGIQGSAGVKRHPCGEIFLAPPPVVLEDDEEDLSKLQWDVGCSEMNPYVCDSWPFEPNVLAARASAEPGFDRVDEEGSSCQAESEAPSEDGMCSSEAESSSPGGSNGMAHGGDPLRLSKLTAHFGATPPEACGDAVPEPCGMPNDLPPFEGALVSSRSY